VAARCQEGKPKADRGVLRISQDRAGFDRFDAWLERQEEPVGSVTMGSSGHYWMCLALMAQHDPSPARDPLAGVELRQASRFAMTLVTEQARVCQRLIRLVESGLPELGELFDDPACRTAREVLRIAPTAAVARKRRTSTLAEANAGPGHRRLGETKAERLRAAAATSIAVAELDEEMAFEVGLLLDQYDLLEEQISAAEAHLASLLDGELARRLQTIPGVGPATCAVLIAEIGDITRFDDADQLLAYAGVHPAERSSGKKGANPETSWHMSKAGNAHLRAVAYRMAVVGVTHNPVIKTPWDLGGGQDLPTHDAEPGLGPLRPRAPAGGDVGQLVRAGKALLDRLRGHARARHSLGPCLRPPAAALGIGEDPHRRARLDIGKACGLRPGEEPPAGIRLSVVRPRHGVVDLLPSVEARLLRVPGHGCIVSIAHGHQPAGPGHPSHLAERGHRVG
jgi:hypothetical protein